MANYSGPVCRFCRREGAKLYLKGERCYTPKCAIERRAFAPGMHGQARKRKTSDYGLQLRAKQKARRIYGLLEKQFRNYFDQASNEPGVTGLNLLRHLELRLDNVVYRIGLGSSRKQARQLVTHRHFEVNGKLVNVPSFQVKPGDELKVRTAFSTWCWRRPRCARCPHGFPSTRTKSPPRSSPAPSATRWSPGSRNS